jgi:hypothetical protein
MENITHCIDRNFPYNGAMLINYIEHWKLGGKQENKTRNKPKKSFGISMLI